MEATRRWDDGVAAAILMMLQGGMMPSEIGRLDVDATVESLAAENPHVLVGYGDAQTKTDSRKRIVPVVVETALVREHLIEGIRWAAGVKEGWGPTINKRPAVLGSTRRATRCGAHWPRTLRPVESQSCRAHR